MSNTYKLFNYKNYKFDSLKYKTPQKSRGNCFVCPVDSDVDILFQTSILKLSRDIEMGEKECLVYLEVDHNNDFFEFYKNLDNYNVKSIHNNCKKWFGDQLSLNTVVEFYKSNITNNELVLVLPVKKGEIQLKIYDQNKNELDSSKLVKDKNVVLVIRNNGIKFLKKQCVLDLDVCQLQLFVEDLEDPIVDEDTKELSKHNSENNNNSSEIIKRMQAKNKINELKTKLTEAVANCEKAQSYANELKEQVSNLATELKKLEDEYEQEEEDLGDESDEE